MNRHFSLWAGTILILIGVLALAFNFAVSIMGLDAILWPLLGLLRLWPLIVVGVGLLFALLPFLVRGKRVMGVFFIPALPILATGTILLFTSTTGWWSAWSWLWPLEVLALAAGFVFAAIYVRMVWLTIPAIIIGLNGLVLQFCAITGWWEAWTALWTVEPLAVGVSLLVVSAALRSKVILAVGLGLCGFASMGLVGMLAILSGSWRLFGLLWPSVLILVGVLLLALSVIHRTSSPRLAVE